VGCNTVGLLVFFVRGGVLVLPVAEGGRVNQATVRVDALRLGRILLLSKAPVKQVKFLEEISDDAGVLLFFR
jgi:hypothetical protein